MAVVTLPSSIGLTPICNECGVALCWDISSIEYHEEKGFWDTWLCSSCNPDYKNALQRWKAQQPITSFSGEFDFLSNFYPDPITPTLTLEHLYQAEKTLDPEWVMRIVMATSPGKAKRMGRQCPIRQDWEEIKLSVMYRLVKEKFGNPELRAKLMATGNRKLIEGNTWRDTFWGVYNGQGKNWLGLILMDIRRKIGRNRQYP